jgi:hypothetical protein
MSQHDFNIANQSFPATRTDLNNALQALASNSSGDAEPSTTFANQWWYETDTNTLKLRNEANNAWLSFATVDQTTGDWTLAHDVDITGTLTATAIVGDITGDVTGNLTGDVTGNINGLTPQASNMQPFNRIINGAMTIDQRNAGASVAFISAAYCLDRWVGAVGTASGTTIQRSTTATTGFSNSALITIGTGAAPSSGAVNRIYQVIEGYNIADLSWGTASAATVTLSFWVRSSVIGTFSGALYGASTIQSYPFNYTISVANTFERKTVTIAGPTTGTWGDTNGTGLYLNFDLGSGTSFKTSAGSWSTGTFIGATSSVNLCATSGATFYITGVQLEAGSSASSFAHENYSDTLRKCRRYLPAYNGLNTFGACTTYTTNTGWCPFLFDTPTRVAPTGISISSAAHFNVVNAGVPSAITINSQGLGTNGAILVLTIAGISGTNTFYSTSALAQILFNGCEL